MVLTDHNSASSSNHRVNSSCVGSGSFFAAGVEQTVTNGQVINAQVENSACKEAQWALDFAHAAPAGATYEFRVAWVGQDGTATITYAAEVSVPPTTGA